ncbi:hypothetical protein ACIA5C_19660 [Actinoplanes sp. NPDC051343]
MAPSSLPTRLTAAAVELSSQESVFLLSTSSWSTQLVEVRWPSWR